ncbi:molybdate ABC transporter substrate-binding protein [Ferrimonas balearica]|uniref:molybdate ABC transporter substrate-binding protein n=1 Tax=Ferrimonas balearica TaxID=44012 RepID=UPI001C98F6CC|nr:molybdate ABC transporter substrate-binding protein [Ferrimonas balearica]MBY5993283.1 molybdate ABC transporter substrate-binding protein [Ferrimonas balearica]
MMRCVRGMVLLCAALLSSSVWATELKVAVAANFHPVFERIAEGFERESGVRVRISSGASGALYTQIRHGAPFDLFLSADSARPALLEQHDLILPGSRATYAVGILAFWSREGGADEARLRLWHQRLAIANARTAPYGEAAEQVLDHLALTDSLKGKLLRGNSVVQAFQYVDSGNVGGGLVALSLLKARAVPESHYWPVPPQWHHPLDQQAVILKRTAEPEAAKALMRYLLEQRPLLTQAGYSVIEAPIRF